MQAEIHQNASSSWRGLAILHQEVEIAGVVSFCKAKKRWSVFCVNVLPDDLGLRPADSLKTSFGKSDALKLLRQSY